MLKTNTSIFVTKGLLLLAFAGLILQVSAQDPPSFPQDSSQVVLLQDPQTVGDTIATDALRELKKSKIIKLSSTKNLVTWLYMDDTTEALTIKGKIDSQELTLSEGDVNGQGYYDVIAIGNGNFALVYKAWNLNSYIACRYFDSYGNPLTPQIQLDHGQYFPKDIQLSLFLDAFLIGYTCDNCGQVFSPSTNYLWLPITPTYPLGSWNPNFGGSTAYGVTQVGTYRTLSGDSNTKHIIVYVDGAPEGNPITRDTTRFEVEDLEVGNLFPEPIQVDTVLNEDHDYFDAAMITETHLAIVWTGLETYSKYCAIYDILTGTQVGSTFLVDGPAPVSRAQRNKHWVVKREEGGFMVAFHDDASDNMKVKIFSETGVLKDTNIIDLPDGTGLESFMASSGSNYHVTYKSFADNLYKIQTLRAIYMPFSQCTEDADCIASPTHNTCDVGSGDCVICVDNADCPAEHTCENFDCVPPPGCDDDTECTDPALPHCETNTHECFECTSNAHCTSGATCQNHECVQEPGCDDNSECASPTPFCQTSTRDCVECLNEYQCGASEACLEFACVAVTCESDDHCTNPAQPHCQTSTGQCKECLTEGDCSVGEDCVAFVCTPDVPPNPAWVLPNFGINHEELTCNNLDALEDQANEDKDYLEDEIIPSINANIGRINDAIEILEAYEPIGESSFIQLQQSGKGHLLDERFDPIHHVSLLQAQLKGHNDIISKIAGEKISAAMNAFAQLNPANPGEDIPDIIGQLEEVRNFLDWVKHQINEEYLQQYFPERLTAIDDKRAHCADLPCYLASPYGEPGAGTFFRDVCSTTPIQSLQVRVHNGKLVGLQGTYGATTGGQVINIEDQFDIVAVDVALDTENHVVGLGFVYTDGSYSSAFATLTFALTQRVTFDDGKLGGFTGTTDGSSILSIGFVVVRNP